MKININKDDILKPDTQAVSPEDNLLRAMAETGMNHDLTDIIADGSFHRFNIIGAGRKANNKHGYYLLNPKSGAGFFGDWKGEFPYTKLHSITSSKAEKAITAMETLAETETKRSRTESEYESVARECKTFWESLMFADKIHPYLVKKHLCHGYGAKAYKNYIVIPFQTPEGRISSLQFIMPDGTKSFVKGGRIAGSFVKIGDSTPRFLAEGFATAASIYQTTGLTTLAAGSSGNLPAVAKSFPGIMVVADNDKPGIAAAEKCNSNSGNPYIVVPAIQDGDTDANDYMRQLPENR